MTTNDRPPPRGLLARFDVYIAAMLLLVSLAIGIFFAILLGVLFQLFGFIDFLLNRSWAFDLPSVLLGVAAVLVAWLALRIARRLALVILGLVTARYDESPTDRALVRLDPDEHSVFYETVADVSRAVGAPRPEEISVAADAECYVMEQRQFALHTSRRRIMVFGLPELLVLGLAELRMIMAHELVHFRHRQTTVGVFLFRFLHSLRQAVAPLRHRWWRRVDPIYGLFLGFYEVVARLAARIEGRQILRADALSAATYGGDLAVRTLLKDWLLANQFEAAREEHREAVAAGRLPAHVNVYRFFVDRWRDFSPASQAYLEERLSNEDEAADANGPSMRTRLAVLRSFPPQAKPEARSAIHLLANAARLEEQLAR